LLYFLRVWAAERVASRATMMVFEALIMMAIRLALYGMSGDGRLQREHSVAVALRRSDEMAERK
jgi:hypothetical protein